MSACNKRETAHKKPVVEVNGTYLYLDDILKDMPKGLKGNDSIVFVQNYTNKWIDNQLFLQKQNMLSSEERQKIDNKVQEFRNSLTIYEIKQKFLSEADTNVTDEEIKEYFQSNKQNFLLSYPIVKGYFIKIPSKVSPSPVINFLKNDDINGLKDYVLSNQGYLKDFSSKWENYYRIVQLLPLNNAHNYSLPKKGIITIKDSAYVYILNIKEIKKDGEVMPFQLCYNDIKNILKKRKQKLYLERISKKLYEEAKNSGLIKYYQ